MYKLTIQNSDLQELNFNELDAAYNITNIQGLSPAEATINTSQAALLDGAFFNSSKVNMRTIDMAFTIERRVEYNRLFVYQVLKVKEPVTIYYKSSALDVFIKGYVKTVNVSHFEAKQIATVQILCPDPYWKAAQEVIDELSVFNSMFYFPFASEGDKNLLQNTASTTTASGITFTVNSDGSVTVNGTATANAYLVVGTAPLNANVTYLLNGCPQGGGRNTYRLYFQGVTGKYDEGEGSRYTPSESGNVNVRIVIYEGATVNNLTFYPMVSYAVNQDDSWQPYGYGEIIFGEIDDQAEVVVQNAGGIETGLTFELFAKSTIVDPKIFNYLTGEFIGINFTMQTGDFIIIKTGRGEKSITLYRNGQESNIINWLMENSTWLMLPSGGAVFVYTIESGVLGNLEITIKHNDLYEGV